MAQGAKAKVLASVLHWAAAAAPLSVRGMNSISGLGSAQELGNEKAPPSTLLVVLGTSL